MSHLCPESGKSHRPHSSHLLPALLLALLLGACTSPPPPVPEVPAAVTAARTADLRGDHAHAAAQWREAALEAADQGDRSTAAEYRLNAAESAWLADNPEAARADWATVEAELLNSSKASHHALLGSELALARGDLDTAERQLAAVGSDLPSALQTRYRAAQRSLAEWRADPSARALTDARARIPASGAYASGDGLAVITALASVPSGRLATLAASQDEFSGWAALALEVRQTLVSRADLLAAGSEWARAWPDHVVDATEFMEICWRYGERFTAPERVVLLLPQDGSLAAAGNAVRDGVFTAFLARPGSSQIDLMAISENPLEVRSAYLRAAGAGYQWAIGPLSRDSVQAIADLDQRPLPVLLLNSPNSPGGAGTGVDPAPAASGSGNSAAAQQFSIALSQQEEAESAVERLLQQDLRRVILLLEDSAWAESAQSAFVDSLLARGGSVVATERFSAGDADHSDRLTRLLQIQDSQQRKNALQTALGVPLEFEPSRRDDFDALFLAAGPDLARQLKPQLRFFDAGGKPMLAMSRVWSGVANSSADRDLDGISFPATRWALAEPERRASRSGLNDLASLRGGAFGSLFALGQDAWDVLPWLALLQSDPDLRFPGQVGDLSVRADGRLQRTPVWARFRQGVPVADPVKDSLAGTP